MRTQRVALVLASMLAATCGAGVSAPEFRILYPDNREEAITAVLQRVGTPAQAAPTNATGQPLVVAAARDVLLVHDLGRDRRLWQAHMPIDSRPIVTPRAILFLSGDDVVALSVEEGGRELWRFPLEESFLGAAATADTAYLVFGTAVSAVAAITERRAGALVAVDVSTGREQWRVETNRQLGRPAVAGDLVLLPWERGYVSVFEGETGAEVARLRSKDDVLSFVEARNEGIFYGGRGLYRLTRRSTVGTKVGQAYLSVPEPVALPGEPRLGADAYVPAVAEAARDKIQTFWAPSVPEGDDLHLASDVVYYLYFKYVFGLGIADGAVHWATRLPVDAVAVTAGTHGLFALDANGTLSWLDATDGLVRHRTAIAARELFAATFDVGSFQPTANVQPTESDLRTRLLQIALDRDNRLAAGRALAARVLGGVEDPAVSADLVQILGRADVPQVIRDAAADGLQGRRTGTAALVEALGPRFDFVARTRPGPVGPLATALGAVRERRAVPALLAHLEDPHTSPEALAAIAKALGEIGDRSAIEPLMTFLTRYHADDTLGVRAPALAEAARALAGLGARPVHARLEALAADPNALDFVRESIRAALAGPPPEPVAPVAAAPASAPASPPPEPPAATPPAAEPAAPPLSRTLDTEQVGGTLSPQLAAMRRCAAPASTEAPAPPPRLRLVFGIVGATGKAEHLAVSPTQSDAVRNCLGQVFEALTFPRFSELRQRVTYVLQTTPPAPAERRPSKARPTKAPPTARGGR